jgi:phosphopantothenoylcysteine decarboxylase / phosphopantothenate---cysteine ligase
MTLQDKKILLGVTGSIAAFKTVFLARELMRRGAEVRVVMTASAQDFIAPLTFATLTDHRVYSDFTEDIDQGTWTNHVELGLWGDLFLVAPATAKTLSAFATGSCANFLQAVYLSARCPVAVAPAMDLDMYSHPATQENLVKLAEQGRHVIEPTSGLLASGLEGKGRMMEPEDLADWVEAHFSANAPLRGKAALLTVGPTHEPIDAVRFLGNRSSGKMGYALARELVEAGAEVHLVSGPVHLAQPDGLASFTEVETADQMYTATMSRFENMDLAIACAAVADARPTQASTEKLHRADLPLAIELTPTKDILKAMGEMKKSHQCLVGFALETDDGVASAKAKIQGKNLDFIVLNTTQDEGAGFLTDTNKITMLTRDGEVHKFGLKKKTEVAQDIVQFTVQYILDAQHIL